MTAASQRAVEATTRALDAPAAEFKAGVYDGMSDATYHADPVPGGSLSSSGARKLLPPSCPALYRYEQDHGRAPKREFDFGHAAHQLVLGAGPGITVVDAKSWRTDAAQGQAEEARAEGKVPLLTAEYETVQAMAAALKRHPIAGRMFNPERGKPEQSLFWKDQKFGIWRRARLDWLPTAGNGQHWVADLKTCRSAAPDRLQKAMWDYGYATQAAWYLDGVRALGLGDKLTKFVFVFQEKTPPYLVTVAEPDPFALQIGAYENQSAMATYRDCMATGHWPGYSDGIESIPLPRWIEAQYAKEITL